MSMCKPEEAPDAMAHCCDERDVCVRHAHTAGPRIALPADFEGAAPMRELCPEEETDTCAKYWAYTGNFVRYNTIPTRDR